MPVAAHTENESKADRRRPSALALCLGLLAALLALLLAYLGWANYLPPEPLPPLPVPNGYDAVLAAAGELARIDPPNSPPPATSAELRRYAPMLGKARAGLQLPFRVPLPG